MIWKRDEDRQYTGVWFLAACSFAAVTAWAVWDNEITRAPWIRDQEAFFRLERRLAREDLAAARRRYRTEGASRVRALDAEIAKLERKLRHGDLAKAHARLEALDAEATRVESDLTFAKSDQDEAYYLRMQAELRVELAKGAARTSAEAEVRRLRAEENADAERVRRAQAQLAALDAKRRPLRTEVGPVEQALEAARRDRASVRRELEEAVQRVRKARDNGLDDVQIQQVALRWRLDERGRAREEVDRCATCHRGIDSPDYADPARVPPELRTHPRRADLFGAHPVERFGCTSCHQGQGRSTERSTAHAHAAPRLDDESGTVRVSWKREGDRFWEEPLLRAPRLWQTRIDATCDELEIAVGEGEPVKVRLDRKTYATWPDLRRALEVKLDRALRPTAPGAPDAVRVDLVGDRLMLSLVRPRGAAEDPPPELRVSWPDDALRRLLGFSGPLTGASSYTATFSPEPIIRNAGPTGASGLQVPASQRERLIVGAPFIEAGCLRCHSAAVDMRPLGSVAAQDDRTATRRLEQARRAAAAGTPADAATAEPPAEPDAEVTVDIAPTLSEGRSIFRRLNCTGCHVLEGFPADRNLGPALAGIGGKASADFLFTWLRDPNAFRPGTRMPTFWPVPLDPATGRPYAEGSPERRAWERRRDEEATAITAFLIATGDSRVPVGYGDVPGASAEEGRRLFESVGCRGCHVASRPEERPGNFATRERDIAPNLSRIGQKTSVDWLTWWIESPSREWPETRMPNIRLTRVEAASIARWLVGLADGPSLAEAPAVLRAEPPADLVARGRRLVSEYGCHGCHTIPGFETAPPVGTELDGYGRKDPATLDFAYAIPDAHQQNWETFTTLKLDAPRIFVRDRIDLKMPDYDLSPHEIRALLVFLAGLTGDRPLPDLDPQRSTRGKAILAGRQIVEDYNCRGCHVIEGHGADIRAYSPDEPDALAVLPPVLRAEGWRTQPEWLYSFLRAPTTIRPWIQVRMPTFGLRPDQTAAVVEYLSALDAQPYPYQRTPLPPMDPARWQAADTMFKELQCQSCHVLGDVVPQGMETAQLAPDLAQVPQRLRPSWLRRWLENPEHLMPGTRMPSYWPEPYSPDPSPYAHGATRTAQEDMDLLVEYLMRIGTPAP